MMQAFIIEMKKTHIKFFLKKAHAAAAGCEITLQLPQFFFLLKVDLILQLKCEVRERTPTKALRSLV